MINEKYLSYVEVDAHNINNVPSNIKKYLKLFYLCM